MIDSAIPDYLVQLNNNQSVVVNAMYMFHLAKAHPGHFLIHDLSSGL